MLRWPGTLVKSHAGRPRCRVGREDRRARPLEVRKVGPRAVSAAPRAERGVAVASPAALPASLPGADPRPRVPGRGSISDRWNLISEEAGPGAIVANFTREEIEGQRGT